MSPPAVVWPGSLEHQAWPGPFWPPWPGRPMMPLAEALPALLPSPLLLSSPSTLDVRRQWRCRIPSYSFLLNPRWTPHNPPRDLLPVFFVSSFFLLSPSCLRDLPFSGIMPSVLYFALEYRLLDRLFHDLPFPLRRRAAILFMSSLVEWPSLLEGSRWKFL